MRKLYFTKRFDKGLLAGLKSKETLDFVSTESANSWIQGVQKYANRNGWTLLEWYFG